MVDRLGDDLPVSVIVSDFLAVATGDGLLFTLNAFIRALSVNVTKLVTIAAFGHATIDNEASIRKAFNILGGRAWPA